MTHPHDGEAVDIFPLAADLVAVAGWDASDAPEAEPTPFDAPRVGPRVVMLAGNNITIDARVLKAMTTTSRFGLDTVAVGLRERADSAQERLGAATVLRVQVPSRVSRAGVTWRVRRVGRGAGEMLAGLSPVFLRPDDRRAALGRWEIGTRGLRHQRGADARAALVSAPRAPALAASAAAPTAVAPVTKVTRAVRWRQLRLQRKMIAAQSIWLRLSPRAKLVRGNGVGAAREHRIDTFRRVPLLARWQDVLPEVLDQELVIGPVLDRLEPDVIHVHDVFMLGIGVHAAQRAALAGRQVKVIYDAHEFIPGLPVVQPRKVAAYASLEREFIHHADHVITVSPSLAALLVAEHGLDRSPSVVLNAPVEDPGVHRVLGVREVCRLDPEVPLLVYGGGVHEARGVHTAVEALAQLPGVHLAVVVKRRSYVTADLEERAARLGVADRLHLAPFVPPELVPRYLASATVGLSPLLRAVNHDVAITNKFCEYLHAGLPIVTSDTPEQAGLVETLGLGAVHRADDPADCARAVREVLAHVDQLRDRIRTDAELKERFSWRAQAAVLRDVYGSLLGDLPAQAWAADAVRVDELLVRR